MQEAEAYVSGAQILGEQIPGGQILGGDNSNSGLLAMQELVSHRMPSFYRTAYRFLRNPADAEDAVQDALLSAYKHLHQFKGEAQISTWLTVIVGNCARMQLRRRLRHTHVSLDEPAGDEQNFSLSEQIADSRPTPEDQYKEAELKRRLREEATQLSPSLLRTYQLRDLAGLSVREAATILDLPVGTVKAQSSRARARLTRSMRRVFGPRRRTAPVNKRREMAEK